MLGIRGACLPRPRASGWYLPILLSWTVVVHAAPGALPDPRLLDEQAALELQRGAFNRAVEDWQKAIRVYHNEGNTRAEIRASVSLAAAYQGIGDQRFAVRILQDALDTAEKKGERTVVPLVQSKLGAALIMTLEPERADALLRESLQTAQANGDGDLAAAVLNDVGNLLVTQQKYGEALATLEESVTRARQATNRWLLAEALGNAAGTAVLAGQYTNARSLNLQALQETKGLAAGHTKGLLLLNAGLTDQRIDLARPDPGHPLRLRAYDSFQQAADLAQRIQDPAIETYALGYLGQLYEADGQTEAALALSQRARFAAQQAQLAEALYRWEWQIARLLRNRGDVEPAIAAYRRAIQTLQPIRSDVSLGYGNATVHLPFRQSEGPLFFELADLLLKQAQVTADPVRSRNLLLEARDTVEQCKAVELEDYFHDDCVNLQKANTRSIESVDRETAVVYLIPLLDRTEILVGLASGLRRYTVQVGADALTAQVRQLRRNLENRSTYAYLDQARQLYDWLIRPILPTLSQSRVKTLVFVPDGALRTIPLASLQDGRRFLIQDFAVAVAPGLSLVEPHPIQRRKVRLLLSGLSDAVQGFAALSYVTGELQSIERLYPSQALVNQGFTLGEFKRQMTDEQYSIVHIASHGKFDRDVRKTFLLTYDDKLTLNNLEALIRPDQYRGRPVELLVLSACQTAAGDDRAALGLAGVAVKAGARSALATLWFVNDQSTSRLISDFYEQLKDSPSLSKARCLQQAQIKLLSDRRYHHPCYWSPYLLIGNWL